MLEEVKEMEKKFMLSRPVDDASSVLIVDHYRFGQQVALRQLTYLGFRADVVMSCRQAIRAFKKHPYEVVLIGWGLALCDGSSVTKFVRRLDEKRGLRTIIVATTLHADHCDRERCRLSGMDDLLAKPITMQDMHGTLMKHLKAA